MTEITPENMKLFMREALDYAGRSVLPMPTAEYPAVGTLRVQVFAAQGAFPISRARVTVSSSDGATLYTRMTDSSGIAEGITLPARAKYLSQSEETAEASGMIYRVTVEHPDFVPVTREIEIYADTESLFPVDLVPVVREGS